MIVTNRMKAGCLVAGMLCLCAVEGHAQSPYGWRGPDRDGVYYESGLLKSWPTGGPQQLWETLDAGKGYSSPVIVGDRLYLTGMNEDENKEIFSAYTLDGKKLYSVEYGSPWTDTYPETRTTPTIEGGKAYVVSGSGEVVCLNIKDGSTVWKVDARKKFEGTTGTWGTSECLLVYDNKVFYTPGGKQTTVVTLDAQTGETVWKSESLGENSSYVSPLMYMHNGHRKIVTVAGNKVIGINPATGKIEWTFDDWAVGLEWEKIAPNTPLYFNGMLFFSYGYDMGSFMLRLNVDATDASLAWRNNDMDTHHGGFVLVDGTIYGSNWTSNTDGNWMAVDWRTGETKYNTAWSGGKGKGSIITADDMLYCYDERRGAVGLVKPNPEKFEVVSEFRVTKGEGPYWAHPVIQDGVLYLRHGNALMAYQIK